MQDTRPVNLDLTKYRFPRMAIVSILHRITGVILFLFLPLLLYVLHQTLMNQQSFEHMQLLLTHPLIKFTTWVFLSAIAFHLIAGIRHLLMDLGLFESLRAGKTTATLVFIFFLIAAVLLGVWLWV